MSIDLAEKVKPSFPETLFAWYAKNGVTDFIKLHGKVPANKGRRRSTHSYESISKHTINGYNIGVLLPPGVLVLDVDAHRNGFADLDRLLIEAWGPDGIKPSLDDLINSTFSVKTGRGGYHLYFSHGLGKAPNGSIKGYGGLDLKSSRAGYVVAPGGVHPETGKAYVVESMPEKLAPLPEQLVPFVLTLIRDPLEKPTADSRLHPHPHPHPLWGVATAGDLRTLLEALDPRDFRSYVGGDSSWLNLLAAAHHATAGSPEAMVVCGDWSARDPDYTTEAHRAVESRWDSFKDRRGSNKPVATINTLIAAVRDSSRQATLLGEHGKRHAKADAKAKTLHQRIEATELEVLSEGNEAANMRAYLATLVEGWHSQAPALLHELADKISEMPDDHWAELSGVLSKSMDGEQSPLQIERLIKKKADKRRKEETKAKLTQAEIVDTAARRALKTLALDSRDLLRPPKAPFYIYRDGYWQHLYDEAVSKSCFYELDSFLDKSTPGLKPLPYYTREALNQVSYMVGTESTALYNREELPSCVNLINGTLWFYSDGTHKLEPHRREDFLTTRLPYTYDPKAECPSMTTMLTQVFDDVRREHSEEEMWDLIRHFWEFAGYILTPKKDIPMMMFFLGQGHNGKSRIAGILSRLLDPGTLLSNDLAAHLDPSNKHGTAALEGKLLAMDDDVGENAEISDRVFKKVCQSKPYSINPKNKDARQIMLQTIVLFIANNGVKIVDTSLGFSRRTYVIEFSDISHLQSSPLPDLVDLMEMPGVLNEAIKGLARLRKRGFFDVPKCAQDFKAKFLVDSNSVLSFWEYCDKTESKDESIKVQELYKGYSYYMSSGGFGKPVSRKAFVKALQRQKITMAGENVTGWKITIVVC